MFRSVVESIKKSINKSKRYFSRNYSLRMKMTLTLIILIALTVSSIWLFNQLFLEDYYIISKIDVLDDTYSFINESYSGEDEKLTDEDIYDIQMLSEIKNVRVYVINDNLIIEYPQADMEMSEYARIFSSLQDYFFRGINKDLTVEELVDRDNYNIYKLHDSVIDASYVELIGHLDNNYIVYMRTNLDSIQENVAISNKFLAIVGLAAIIIGSVIMFFITKKFTQPIHKLSEIAKKMTNLDFTVKYEGKTRDEIDVLGTSINTLSEKLEHTISELKGANNELRLDIENKIKNSERQQEFISNVSHELKTPISIIQGYAEGLKENVYEDEESKDYYCDVIIDETSKMNQIVKRLISLSYLESGDSDIQFEHFDIVDVIRSIIDSNLILFDKNNITCIFNYFDPIHVWGDVYLVEEVLNNYISNAINHAQGKKIIKIEIKKQNKVIRISIFNTGKNISEEDLLKIWDKFYKVDKSRTREYGGSGIGLSIVKASMNSLNQDFGVVNHDNGVEFWFELDSQSD